MPLHKIQGRGGLRALTAEFTGTLLYVFVACGAAAAVAKEGGAESIGGAGPAGSVQIALAFGLTYAVITHCFAHISGAHINPVVTLALLVTRKIKMARAVCYVGAQILGAVVGAAILDSVTGEEDMASLGALRVSSSLKSGEAFGLEFMLTFMLVVVIFATIDPERLVAGSVNSGPLHIGLAVTAAHLFGLPFTGAGLNPARAFGPALVADVWDDHWCYWLGPITGGTFAGLLYSLWFDTGNMAGITEAFLGRSQTNLPAITAADVH